VKSEVQVTMAEAGLLVRVVDGKVVAELFLDSRQKADELALTIRMLADYKWPRRKA